ncbi:hypothetical protein FACS1894120_4370 [Clostridia bacterium]|nr:hypothetical protein FACS1894120_4370 [Clostridia bacterium]
MLIIILRAVILYFVVIFTLRLMGKKQLGELQPSELVTTIMVSNIATISLEEPSVSLPAGIMPILAIACIDVFMSAFMMKSSKLRRLVAGSPRVLIRDGQIIESELKNLRYTLDDIYEAMRDGGIFDISQVTYAVVETTGKINFLEVAQGAQNPQAEASAPQINPPAVIIRDGELDLSELVRTPFTEDRVAQILKERKLPLSGVLVMWVKSGAEFEIVEKQP